MDSQASRIAKLAFIHVGSLFAATMAIITIIETINAVSLVRQAKREGWKHG